MAEVSIKSTARTVKRQENAALKKIAASRTVDAGVDAIKTHDNFQNFAINLGLGTDNGLSGGSYGYNPITRVRILLEWIHRGSWLGGVAVDLVADDMSRAGIEITSTLPPEAESKINSTAVKMNIWGALGDTVRWGRLYGGAIAVILLDGQDTATPLRLDTVDKKQFKGLYVLDRWMINPSLNDLVTEPGPDLGLPKFYKVISDGPALRGANIHHSRCIRMDGVRLPYWQAVSENLWGISILERIYDRMIAFDSATMGAAQLVYKMYLRTLKLDGFREAAVAGGDALKGITRQVNTMRTFQSQEGVTLIDGKDELQIDSSNVTSGISDALIQFAQQLSGALQIPLVRLFGQSPAGLNSTGESDLRTYYDNVKNQQERFFRVGVDKIYRCIASSEGVKLPEDFEFEFRNLWQLTEEQRANVANTTSTAIVNAHEAGLIPVYTAMKELKQSSRDTGIFSSISDDDIKVAEENPPEMTEPAGPPGIEKVKNNVGAGAAATIDRAFDLGGLPVQIETPKGTSRPGHSCIVAAHYGYIRGTHGADGDAVDCFVGPELGSDAVWIIDQVNPSTKKFDEHKVMLGFKDWPSACAAYQGSFHAEEGAGHLGPVRRTTIAGLRDWLPRSNIRSVA